MLPRLLNLGLLVAFVLVSALVWPTLPDTLPGHFDLQGNATRWDGKDTWFYLPLFALALTGLLFFVGRLIARRPDLINMPDKDRFLLLPLEDQKPVIQTIQSGFWMLGTLGTFVMGMIQFSTYQTAVGQPSQGFFVAIIVVSMIAPLAVLIPMLLKIQEKMDEAVRKLPKEPPVQRQLYRRPS